MSKPGEPIIIGERLFVAPTECAKELRRNQTDAERHLWQRLRAGQLGAKFRRQHPFAGYILDFCCISHWLVVELDGVQHGEPGATQADARRDERLRTLGFQVVRFTNDQALRETEMVVEEIWRRLSVRDLALPPLAPPSGRGICTEDQQMNELVCGHPAGIEDGQ